MDKVSVPLGDDDIKKVLPDAKILKYTDLAKFNNIDQMLPNKKDYAYLLYLDSPNTGHWVLCSKYNDIIEVFDPYGQKNIDDELLWISKPERRALKTNKPHLTRLLNDCDYKVIFNGYRYQILDNDIQTCGRHCTYRCLQMLKHDKNLMEYFLLMKELKKKTKKPYDVIVSEKIDI
jgi:hypothetical protein